MRLFIALDLLTDVDRRAVKGCPDCFVRDDDAALLCGWHENLVAAVRAVARLAEDEQ
jgi:hypothetical protein